MIEKWPVIVVSMPSASVRRVHMKETFKEESLIFSAGYNPDSETKRDFADKGILSEKCVDSKIPTIGEIGCALGHRNAWQWIIDNVPSGFAVVMEDDVEPTENYHINVQKSVEKQGGLNPDATVTFLCHDGGFGCPSKTRGEDGKLLSGPSLSSSGNYCYVMNRKGALRAIKKQFPMYDANDIQWRGLDDMYLIEKPIIRQASIGRYSQIKTRR